MKKISLVLALIVVGVAVSVLGYPWRVDSYHGPGVSFRFPASWNVRAQSWRSHNDGESPILGWMDVLSKSPDIFISIQENKDTRTLDAATLNELKVRKIENTRIDKFNFENRTSGLTYRRIEVDTSNLHGSGDPLKVDPPFIHERIINFKPASDRLVSIECDLSPDALHRWLDDRVCLKVARSLVVE